MNWERTCKWTLKEENGNLHVTLEVNHIMGTRKFVEETYDSDFVISYLKDNKIKFGNIIKEAVVHNHHSYEKCSGTWIFSLPKEKKSKKTTQALENKENVLKVSNKKTTKK